MEYNYTFDNNIYNNGPMVLDNNTSYEYIIDNLDNSISMGGPQPCKQENEEITEIIKIKNGIINVLNNNDDIFEENGLGITVDDGIKSLIEDYDKFYNDYKVEQKNYFEIEEQLHNEIEKSNS